ncbi:hypothetical protein MXB_4737 [Myxobolus squamalis]|nr:hypothetical protein MXB_4737 [Myxobolus squamalis]
MAISVKLLNLGKKAYVEAFDPRDYVYLLEKWMIETCEKFNIHPHRSSDVGVWMDNKKIGALGLILLLNILGVHIRNRRITTHGIALNCNVDLCWFDHIVPCGLVDKGTTSISTELHRNVTCFQVLPVLLNSFESTFDVKLVDV